MTDEEKWWEREDGIDWADAELTRLRAALSEKEAALLGAQNQRDEIMRVSHEDAAALCRTREALTRCANAATTPLFPDVLQKIATDALLIAGGPCHHEAALERYINAVEWVCNAPANVFAFVNEEVRVAFNNELRRRVEGKG